MALVLITHNMGVIADFADRVFRCLHREGFKAGGVAVGAKVEGILDRVWLATKSVQQVTIAWTVEQPDFRRRFRRIEASLVRGDPPEQLRTESGAHG